MFKNACLIFARQAFVMISIKGCVTRSKSMGRALGADPEARCGATRAEDTGKKTRDTDVSNME